MATGTTDYDALAAVVEGQRATIAELRQLVERKDEALREIGRWSDLVMSMLDQEGPSIVPHLLDTDDNPGQYLRDAITEARAATQTREG